MQQATVDRLKDQLEKHTIISRFAGYVTAEHTEVGQWVKQGDPVAEVAALDEVEVVAQVVEQYVPHIRVGMTVSVEIPAFAGRSFTGVVSRDRSAGRRAGPNVSRQGARQESSYRRRAAGEVRHVRPRDVADWQKADGDARVQGRAGAGRAAAAWCTSSTRHRRCQAGQGPPVPVQLGVAEGNMIQVTGELEAGPTRRRARQRAVAAGPGRADPARRICRAADRRLPAALGPQPDLHQARA